ncbi:MAG: diacylglycerol kinase family lipid kinase, partial [Verrucomicrobiota bacterium]|nr:diacylglycerol kinase family lipid kinase [Verrucomicrobiota bacterium]
ACQLAASAAEDGFETVIAAGGDGTLNEVLNGLENAFGRVRLGLLPLGTGNDFARSLKLPTEVDAALGILAAGHTRRVDILRLEGASRRHALNVSAGGFSGTVNEKLTDKLKATWGPLSYVRGFVEALPELADYHTEIVLDEEERIEVPAYNIVVANGAWVAKGLPIAPEAQIDDGLADLVLIPAASIAQLAVLAPQILLGSHLASDLVVFRRARKIVVKADPPMNFNTDGEWFGGTPVTFTVLPRAIEVLAPLPE